MLEMLKLIGGAILLVVLVFIFSLIVMVSSWLINGYSWDFTKKSLRNMFVWRRNR